MKRVIKFRGKRKDGEWVYGMPSFPDGRNSVMYMCSSEDGVMHRTDFETTGQFTGLVDLHGVEIYEGDIYERELHLIMYGSDLDELCIERRVVTWNDDYGGYYFGEDPVYAVLFQGHDDHTLCRVTKMPVRVGNIHDNPELLEVQS